MWTDYYDLHAWFDASKAWIADARHRAFRHHSEGIFQAQQVFGVLWERPSLGKGLPLRLLGEQHVKEDFRFGIPTAWDWAQRIAFADWMKPELPVLVPEMMASDLAERWGDLALVQVALPIAMWLEAPSAVIPDCRYRYLRYHSEAPEQAEQIFGPLLPAPEGEPFSTRQVTHDLVQLVLGRVPSPVEWAREMQLERWMASGARQLSVELEQEDARRGAMEV